MEVTRIDETPDPHMQELWQMIYRELPAHLPLAADAIKLWFGTTELKYISGNETAYFAIDNYLKKVFIEGHYMAGFEAAVASVLGFSPKPVLVCTEREPFVDQFLELMGSETPASAEDARKTEAKPADVPRIRDVFPPEREDPDANSDATPGNLKDAIHHGLYIPKKYNAESGRTEEGSFSEMLNPQSDGLIQMSPSTPESYPSYTFENFVVGSSNRFAYHYALQASRYPAQQYNPLYLYGPPGVGKTHLLYAITNEIIRLNPSFNIIYVKGEDFTNELVEALQKKTPLQFRDKYRNADVLLMDDIQFIAGKESTQEEFFHTYNTLYESNKQIIMTSDKPPRDIKELEERLRSRFEGGPIVKIDPPDIELRMAIIRKKFEALNVEVSNDVIVFLGENIKDNVRQIEGIIKKMYAYSMMCHVPITLEMAQQSISDIINFTSSIDSRKILHAVSEAYGVSQDEILGKKRSKEIAWARHVAIHLMRKLTDMSYNDIGRFFNRDHSTTMTSDDKIKIESERDPAVAKEIQDLIDRIKMKA